MLGYLVTIGVLLVIYLAVLGLHLLTYRTMCPSALNAAWRNARSDESGGGPKAGAVSDYGPKGKALFYCLFLRS